MGILVPAARRSVDQNAATELREAVRAAGGIVTAQSGNAFLESLGVSSPTRRNKVRIAAGLKTEPGINIGTVGSAPWVWFIDEPVADTDTDVS